jgi:hypothetical protein
MREKVVSWVCHGVGIHKGYERGAMGEKCFAPLKKKKTILRKIWGAMFGNPFFYFLLKKSTFFFLHYQTTSFTFTWK